MAGRGGPTFLKRQKEQKRTARANAKRAAQQARRDSRAAGVKEDDTLVDEIPARTDEDDQTPAGNPAD